MNEHLRPTRSSPGLANPLRSRFTLPWAVGRPRRHRTARHLPPVPCPVQRCGRTGAGQRGRRPRPRLGAIDLRESGRHLERGRGGCLWPLPGITPTPGRHISQPGNHPPGLRPALRLRRAFAAGSNPVARDLFSASPGRDPGRAACRTWTHSGRRSAAVGRQRQRPHLLRRGTRARHCPGPAWPSCPTAT